MCMNVNICIEADQFSLFGGPNSCVSPTTYGGLFLSGFILAIVASLALIVSDSDDLLCSDGELSFRV